MSSLINNVFNSLKGIKVAEFPPYHTYSVKDELKQQVKDTIEETIKKFLALGYNIRMRGVHPAAIAEEIVNNPAAYRLDRIDLNHLADPDQSYLVESDLIKNTFYNAIAYIPPKPDMHKMIKDIANISRHNHFHYKDLSFEFTDKYIKGERTTVVKINIGNVEHDISPDGFENMANQILIKLDRVISKSPYNMRLFRIEGTRNFVVLSDSEKRLLEDIAWKFTTDYMESRTY